MAENIGFGLRAQGVRPAEAAPRVAEALALVRMSEHAAKPVTALSGGQQQRVAVARALVVRPSLVVRPDVETAGCAVQAAKGRLAGRP